MKTEKAKSAYGFINSIGVNTHLNYFDRTYGNFPFVERELRSIGILHLRDGIHLQNRDYDDALYGRWVKLGNDGIRFDAVLDPRSQLGAITPELLTKVLTLSGNTIESFEGANEMDISGISNWVSIDSDFQKALLSAVRSLPKRSQISLLGPSLAFAAHGSRFDGAAIEADQGNLHSYPAGKMPSVLFPEQMTLARAMYGDRQVMITESGYHNALNDHSDQPAVSETAAAKYIPRLFLEDFASGIQRTYLYEFLDEAPDPELKNNQLHWGLIRADGTEKPAFVSMRRLIAELHDKAEPASLTELSWSLTPSMKSAHHVLLEKSTGELDLIIWNELSSFDVKKQAEIVNPPSAAVLTLRHKARRIVLYEPVVQDAPIKVYENTASVPISIPDHPLVIEISLR